VSWLLFAQVGMSIDPKLLVAKFPKIMGALALLIVGKTLIVTGLGRCFGLSTVAAVRSGLFLAPGGEFAFVAFGEAVNQVSTSLWFYLKICNQPVLS
jgi:Kef-type K+ transport system membrane component KefB